VVAVAAERAAAAVCRAADDEFAAQNGEQNANGARTKLIDLSSFGNKSTTTASKETKAPPVGMPAQAIGMKPPTMPYDVNRGAYTATAGLNTPPPNVAFAQPGHQAYNYAMLPAMAMGNAQQSRFTFRSNYTGWPHFQHLPPLFSGRPTGDRAEAAVPGAVWSFVRRADRLVEWSSSPSDTL